MDVDDTIAQTLFFESNGTNWPTERLTNEPIDMARMACTGKRPLSNNQLKLSSLVILIMKRLIRFIRRNVLLFEIEDGEKDDDSADGQREKKGNENWSQSNHSSTTFLLDTKKFGREWCMIADKVISDKVTKWLIRFIKEEQKTKITNNADKNIKDKDKN